MSNQEDVLAAILELRPPWKVEAAEVDIDRRRIGVVVDFERGGRFLCAACGFGGAAAHDSAPAVYLLHGDGLAGWTTEIRARVPRVRCSSCGRVRRVSVTWERIARRRRGALLDGKKV